MVNRYTSDRRVRSDDAYTPGGLGGKRPDRCVIVYSQRLREAYKTVPIVVGGIEASLRRIAHFDYWSEQYAARFSSTRKRICWCTAMRNAKSARLRSVCTKDRPSTRSRICAERPSCGAAFPRIGSKSTPRNWMPPDPWRRRSIPTRTRTSARGRCGRRRCAGQGATADAPPTRRLQPAPGSTNIVKFYRKVPNARRETQRHSPALVRAGQPGCSAVCACVANPASGIQSGKRARAGAAPWHLRRVAQSAADPARDRRHGRGVRIAVCARCRIRATGTRRFPPTT